MRLRGRPRRIRLSGSGRGSHARLYLFFRLRELGAEGRVDSPRYLRGKSRLLCPTAVWPTLIVADCRQLKHRDLPLNIPNSEDPSPCIVRHAPLIAVYLATNASNPNRHVPCTLRCAVKPRLQSRNSLESSTRPRLRKMRRPRKKRTRYRKAGGGRQSIVTRC